MSGIAALVGKRKSLLLIAARHFGLLSRLSFAVVGAYRTPCAGSMDKSSSHLEGSSLSRKFEFEQRSDGDIRWVFAPITLGPSIPQSMADIESKILPFVRPRWNPQSFGHCVFEEGVSNRLFGFFENTSTRGPNQAEDIVLVRINGEGREAFIDSRMEILVMLTLHRAALNPPVYLVAENAICYGYIPGTSLSADDYQVRRTVAVSGRYREVWQGGPCVTCCRSIKIIAVVQYIFIYIIYI